MTDVLAQQPAFARLLEHLGRGGAWQYWWITDGVERRTYWWPVGKPAAHANGRPGAHTYFGVHPTARAGKGNLRAKIEPGSESPEIVAVNCLFAEFDAHHAGELDQVRAYIDGLEPPPSVLTFSGGGYHAYWLLAETLVLDTPEARERARRAQYGWVAFVQSDPAAKDLARVLRVPGTRNWKAAYGPDFPTCTIVYANFGPERLYTLDELEHAMQLGPADEPISPVIPASPRAFSGNLTAREQAYVDRAVEREIDKVARAAQGMRNQQLNNSALALGEFVGAGLVDRAGIEDALEAAANANGLAADRESGGITQVRRSIQSGLTDGMKSPRSLPAELAEPPAAAQPDVPPDPPDWVALEAERPVAAPDAKAQPQAKPNPYALQARTIADAMLPRVRPPAIIKGILPSGSLTLWYGHPGSLKSNILMDMAFSVLTGTPWLPGLPGTDEAGFEVVRPGPVLWLDVDNGEEVLSERVAAFARAYNAPVDAPFRWLTFPVPPVVATRDMSALAAYIRELAPVFIVIDNLLGIAGVADENDNAQMEKAMQPLRLLVERTGAAIAIVHHSRKDMGLKGAAGDGARGGGVINGRVDTGFEIKREGDSLTISTPKVRRRPVPTFGAMWTFTLQDDDETLQEARFWRAEPAPSKADETLEIIREQVVDLLKHGPANQTEICKAVGKRKETILTVLNGLVSERRARTRPGRRNETLYELF